jgi:hypothetical protein
MQFSAVAAIAALAATVSAWENGTVVYTTDVYTAYTTVCPASTELTYNGVTYTATESTTLTITNCPCTIIKPVTTSSVVAPSSTPVYANSTTVATTAAHSTTAETVVGTTKTAVGTTSAKASATATPSTISASSGNKAFAFSGASLAGVLGLAAYFL